MNYPIWQLDYAGGGLLIALIAVFHVYISHFAIGGGLFLVLTEMKGYREDSPAILAYTRQHAKFFLLLSMVLGGMSGVGIWFTIALLNPGATSLLIHNYVFAWAVEWVFFLGEIVALFIYYYTFGTMARRQHLQIGWLYFIFAWLSLFVINGIISFMLTPGEWLVTGNFWDGFFNPGFWPALFFRTFLAMMLAGLFGFITSTSLQDDRFRENMVRYCGLWLLTPFYFFLAAAYWYIHSLPEPTRDLIFNRMPELVPFIKAFCWISPVIFLGGLLMAIRLPGRVKRPLAGLLLLIGLVYMGCFEFIREGGRRPYIIHGHTYSNAIRPEAVEKISATGLLQSAKWAKHKEITEENQLAAGREIFNLLCLPCHSINGPLNDIVQLTAGYSVAGLATRISCIGKGDGYMPPFAGNDVERLALTNFIVKELHNKNKQQAAAHLFRPPPPTIPPFDRESDDYVLLAWTDFGIHTITDSDADWSFRPPGSNLYALLIKRDPTPERVSERVILTYMVESSHADPAARVKFWQYAKQLIGRDLPPNTGIFGKKLMGIMNRPLTGSIFEARGLPLLPYTENNAYQPYPLVTITAMTPAGKILATTRTVLPVSTEVGCKNCHGDTWRMAEAAGLDSKTARNVLAAHDKLSNTRLVAEAAAGRPVMCQSCHRGNSDRNRAPGKQLNLSAAIHGFHAILLGDLGAESCYTCHAADPEGNTRFYRGIHKEIGLDCTNCHGPLEDHALSLLLAEQAAGKERADFLIKALEAKSSPEVQPRQAWAQQPDCLNCHENFAPPEVDTTFNQWTSDATQLFRNRTDEVGIPCGACHGAPHALYPATNFYGKNRDNLVPLQYQKQPYPVGANHQCRVCHRQDMEDEMHHPNSLRRFRNPR